MIGTARDYPSNIRTAVLEIARIAAVLENADDRTAGPVGTVPYPIMRHDGTVSVHMVRVTISRRAGIAGPAGTAYLTCACDAHAKGFAMCRGMADTAYIFGGAAVAISREMHRR